MCSLCLVSYLHVRDYLKTRRKNINLKKSVHICKHSSSTSQEADYGRSELLTGLPLRCHVSTWGRVQLKGANNWLWSECWLAMTFKDTFPHEAFIGILRGWIFQGFWANSKGTLPGKLKEPTKFLQNHDARCRVKSWIRRSHTHAVPFWPTAGSSGTPGWLQTSSIGGYSWLWYSHGRANTAGARFAFSRVWTQRRGQVCSMDLEYFGI